MKFNENEKLIFFQCFIINENGTMSLIFFINVSEVIIFNATIKSIHKVKLF
jgi:hypothetical protein